MFRRGITLTAGELREILSHFSEDTEISFQNASGAGEQFVNLTWDGAMNITIDLVDSESQKDLCFASGA